MSAKKAHCMCFTCHYRRKNSYMCCFMDDICGSSLHRNDHEQLCWRGFSRHYSSWLCTTVMAASKSATTMPFVRVFLFTDSRAYAFDCLAHKLLQRQSNDKNEYTICFIFTSKIIHLFPVWLHPIQIAINYSKWNELLYNLWENQQGFGMLKVKDQIGMFTWCLYCHDVTTSLVPEWNNIIIDIDERA